MYLDFKIEFNTCHSEWWYHSSTFIAVVMFGILQTFAHKHTLRQRKIKRELVHTVYKRHNCRPNFSKYVDTINFNAKCKCHHFFSLVLSDVCICVVVGAVALDGGCDYLAWQIIAMYCIYIFSVDTQSTKPDNRLQTILNMRKTKTEQANLQMQIHARGTEWKWNATHTKHFIELSCFWLFFFLLVSGSFFLPPECLHTKARNATNVKQKSQQLELSHQIWILMRLKAFPMTEPVTIKYTLRNHNFSPMAAIRVFLAAHCNWHSSRHNTTRIKKGVNRKWSCKNKPTSK